MYILIVCILAPLIQNGLSLNGEEIDLKSLSSHETADDIDENSAIWGKESDEGDAGTVVFDSISNDLLEKVCKNSKNLVYITAEDVTIDCKVFNSEQPIEVTIVKRSADDVEGSGNEAEPEGTSEKAEANAPTTQADEDNNDINTEATTKKPEEIPPSTEEKRTEAETQPSTEEQRTEAETPPSTEEERTETEGEDNASTPEPSGQVEIKSEQTESEAQEVTTLEPPATNQAATNPVQISAEPPTQQKEDHEPIETDDKKVENEEPNQKENSDTEKSVQINEGVSTIDPLPVEEKPKETGTEFKPKSEHDPKKDAEIIGGRGKTLLGTQKEEARDNGNDAKTDESTQDTKKAGSKDTTILVVLFVAVLVVGAAAVGYNFIKKRQQRSADLEAAERAPAINRSSKNSAEADNEGEKKPLMGKEVEMVDLKKENNVHEATENATTSNATAEKAPSEAATKS